MHYVGVNHVALLYRRMLRRAEKTVHSLVRFVICLFIHTRSALTYTMTVLFSNAYRINIRVPIYAVFHLFLYY